MASRRRELLRETPPAPGRAWKAAATVEPVPGDPKARVLTVRVARVS